MQRLAIIPILLTLPFLYLGVTNALVIAEEKITFSTFWSLTQNEYDWTDGVKYVDIDYSISIESDSNRKSFNGKYILHFSDGKQIDLWANTLEGGIDTVQEIDSFIQTKNIPFTFGVLRQRIRSTGSSLKTPISYGNFTRDEQASVNTGNLVGK